MQARQLAEDAREATRRGHFGRALASWAELLDSYPFDAPLVKEAESSRASLVQAGLEQVALVHKELERARFFLLPDLYRACREDALMLVEGYAGSEVLQEAQALLNAVDAEIEKVDAHGHGDQIDEECPVCFFACHVPNPQWGPRASANTLRHVCGIVQCHHYPLSPARNWGMVTHWLKVISAFSGLAVQLIPSWNADKISDTSSVEVRQ